MISKHDITALILAGGKGSRLQSVVPDRQKVVAKIPGVLTTSTSAKADRSVAVSSLKNSSVSTSISKTIKLNAPTVAKNTPVKITLTLANGKTFVLANQVQKSAGTFTSPTLKFGSPGTYKVTITVGKKSYQVTVKVTK